MEIVSILVVSEYITSRELALEFGVCIRTVCSDITVLSYGNPIYTKPGLTEEFLLWTVISRTTIRLHNTSRKTQKLYDETEGEDKKSWNVFSENMGAYKLKL